MQFMKSSLILCAFLLSGCGLLSVVKNMTIEQKEAVLHDASQGAIAITLTKVYDNKAERIHQAQDIKMWVDEVVLKALSNDPTAAVAIADGLFDKMPPEYSIYMNTVVNLLQVYVETPDVGEIIGEENYRMVVAVLQGISDGCQSVIDYETAN